MRALITCVDFSDLLRLTLPYNRHHWTECLVVTSKADTQTQVVAHENGAKVHATDAFFAQGAPFRKYLAIEEALDVFGRHGWLALVDADALWPWSLPSFHALRPGFLYGPRRRMADPLPSAVPAEDTWKAYPLHPQQREVAGFTQIFHASDPHLPPPPWHDTSWAHAGGGDSFFQALWPENCRVRPGWEVLHLGGAGHNWCGRATPYIDGSRHPEADAREARVRGYIRRRTHGPDRFSHEKIKAPP